MGTVRLESQDFEDVRLSPNGVLLLAGLLHGQCQVQLQPLSITLAWYLVGSVTCVFFRGPQFFWPSFPFKTPAQKSFKLLFAHGAVATHPVPANLFQPISAPTGLSPNQGTPNSDWYLFGCSLNQPRKGTLKQRHAQIVGLTASGSGLP